MLWAGLSLFSAFTLATTDALVKNVLQRHDEYIVAWLWIFMSLPFLLPVAFFVEWPLLDREFYIAFLSALPLEALALILYTKALKASPLSLSLPFLSLTPVALRLRGKTPPVSAREVTASAKAMLIPGLVTSLSVVSHTLAMSMTQVAYMIALKRTSLLFGVLYGYFVFKEGNIRERFLGAALMFSGFVLVVLG